MKHQIEDALFKALRNQGWDLTARHIAAIANTSPIIERALRAAYLEACLDDDSRKVRNSNHGVTAGVAAMVEGDNE